MLYVSVLLVNRAMCQRKKEAWILVQQDAETALGIDSQLMKVLLLDYCHAAETIRGPSTHIPHVCCIILGSVATAGGVPSSAIHAMVSSSGALSFGNGIEAYTTAARINSASQAGIAFWHQSEAPAAIVVISVMLYDNAQSRAVLIPNCITPSCRHALTYKVLCM